MNKFILILCITITFNICCYKQQVFAQPLEKPALQINSSLEMDGRLPIIDDKANDEKLAQALNDKIMEIHAEKLRIAKKNNIKKIEFDYDYKESNNCGTILFISKITALTTKEEITTINFDIETGEILTLYDFLGVNALQIVNRIVLDEMRKSPDRYNAEFDGVSNNQNFFIEDEDIVLVFNENEIAFAAEGIVKIRVNLNAVKNVVISDYRILKDYYELKMIPLREVCTGFGYNVSWNLAAKSVVVTRGDFTANITIDKNLYSKGKNAARSLESAPLLIDGVCFVPLSFFELMLDASYSFDEDENIIFSQYNPAPQQPSHSSPVFPQNLY